MDLVANFYIALRMLHQPLEELYEKLRPIPSCIICDKYIACVADIANKFKVPRILFDGTNCFHLLCNHNLHISKVHEAISGDEKFLVPGLPDRIEMRKSQLAGIFNPGKHKELVAYREEVREAEAKAHGMVVNTFEELEAEYVREYRRVTSLKIWCVGPVSLSNKDDLDKALRCKKNSNNNNENQYMKWLDSWPPNSVEATKRPFIRVIRGAYGREEMDKWLLEDRFDERVKGRGLLVKDWAPQVLILSHKAIGAFLTHCGWNSTLEGICAGVPLVTFPRYADQFYSEKVAVQLMESGVSVGAETVVHLGEEDKSPVQVTKENVRDAMEKVMGEGEENEKTRERARKYADMAKKAIEEGGSSHRNMSLLVEDIVHGNGLNKS